MVYGGLVDAVTIGHGLGRPGRALSRKVSRPLMAKHGEHSRDTLGPADASRREAGPAPDFELVRPYVGSLGDESLDGESLADESLGRESVGGEPAGEQPIGEHVIPTHRRYGRRSKVSVDPPDATAEIVYPPMSGGFGLTSPATGAGARRLPRHTPLVLALAIVVIVGIVAVYMFRPMPTTPASESFMPMPATIPSFAPSVQNRPSAVASTVQAKPPRSKKPRASGSPSASASASPRIGFGPGGGPLVPSSPSPRPPETAAVGAITGVGGLCVDDNGRLSNNGNPIQVYTCNGSAAQIWTVATNDTLQVLGKCMRVSGSEILLWDCDGSASEIWHRGAHGSLLNPATGLCLDDPQWTTSGGHLDIASCNGAANQSWLLPTS
jgi:hypothetical protein